MKHLILIPTFVFISLLTGCSKSWEEKHLNVNGAGSYEAGLVLDRTINGIIFCLDIGIKFDEPNEPFCARLGALSEFGKEKLITIHEVDVYSSEGTKYELISKNDLPYQFGQKPWKTKISTTKSRCNYEFPGRLTPSFDKKEILTVKIKIEVAGEEKELTFELTPVIKTFSYDDLPHHTDK